MPATSDEGVAQLCAAGGGLAGTVSLFGEESRCVGSLAEETAVVLGIRVFFHTQLVEQNAHGVNVRCGAGLGTSFQ